MMLWKPRRKTISNIIPVPIRQKLSLGNVSFTLPVSLSFTRQQWSLSLGRTRTMNASALKISQLDRKLLVEAIGTNLDIYLHMFLDQRGHEFSFTDTLDILADDERTSAAARVGSAIADIVMEGMGFHWRANTRDLGTFSFRSSVARSKRFPDFVYDPGGKLGFQVNEVAVTEAKGSLSKKRAKSNAVKALAKEAYNQQVRHFIGSSCGNVSVESGWAIAFGSVPQKNPQSSSLAIASPHLITSSRSPKKRVRTASLSAAAAPVLQVRIEEEQRQPVEPQPSWGQGGPRGPGDGGRSGAAGGRSEPNGRVAYANYEAVFQLAGALDAANIIRRVLVGGRIYEDDNVIQTFEIVEHAGVRFLTSPLARVFRFFPMLHHDIFAIYEPSALTMLRSLSQNLDGPPPTMPIARASLDVDEELQYEASVAMHGDGLAVISNAGAGSSQDWHLLKGDWL